MRNKKKRGNKNNFVTKKELNSFKKVVDDLTIRVKYICHNLNIDVSDIYEA